LPSHPEEFVKKIELEGLQIIGVPDRKRDAGGGLSRNCGPQLGA
jgi:hypothetical protein